DRFYQVEGTESQGTGIGLSLARELVELHNGQISVESVKGQGTTFKVRLPYRREYLPAEAAIPPEMDEEERPARAAAEGLLFEEGGAIDNASPSSGQPLALVVEDNPDLRRYIVENIQNDFLPIVAKDGQMGIDTAIEKIPDIIISDVMMPGKNGFELCSALKADARTSHIPIILLTAKAGQQHKIEGLEQGADDYLTKPFDVRELNVRMANLVEQRRCLRERFSGGFKLQPDKVSLNSMDERFLQSIKEQVEANIGNEFYTVEELARAVGFSRSQLHRKLKALTDKSPNQLIREFRLARAKELLEQKAGSVSEIAYQVGYSNLSYFSKSYKDAFGVSPSEV
ncbi:MAG: helix-turn-helix domain-containing protein, partial [Phaeodactylibacter sp.]|nr:helix-turn-helix domain-containing protein [Phaeodactylibacter sp.]